MHTVNRIAKTLLAFSPNDHFRKIFNPTGPHVSTFEATINSAANPIGNIDAWFQTADGRPIPVYSNYRYKIKDKWNYYPSLAALIMLKNLGRLNKNESARLEYFKGSRTLSTSLDDINQYAMPIIEREKRFFLDIAIHTYKTPVQKVSERDLNRKIGNTRIKLLNRFDSVVARSELSHGKGRRAVEIGFGEGVTTFALERLGWRVTGVDNAYDGFQEKPIAHRYYADIIKSSAEFLFADITKPTSLIEGDVSLIISESVLEHIKDLRSAFKEMHRLLDHGGFMLHSYNPYFGCNGGHLACTLDSPWAHARISNDDMERYVTEFRPFEAKTAMWFYENALTRDWPISAVQKAIVDAGFSIMAWINRPARATRLRHLTPEVVSDVLSVNKDITISDITTEEVIFLCRKG